MNEIKYSSAELMIINAARMLRDHDVVFVGVGQPNLACNLAKRTHAPNLVMIYEAGVIGAEPARLPLSIGDPTLVSGSLSVVSMYDIFTNYLQRGNVDYGKLLKEQAPQIGPDLMERYRRSPSERIRVDLNGKPVKIDVDVKDIGNFFTEDADAEQRSLYF